MANILIIGASKGIGLEVAKRALACGHRVRAFARSTDSITLTDQKLEKLNGDALNKEDVTSALQGMDAVIQTLGIALGPELLLGPVRLFSEATRILVSAMQAAGVKRLISVTGFGAGDSRASIWLLSVHPFSSFLRSRLRRQRYSGIHNSKEQPRLGYRASWHFNKRCSHRALSGP